LHSVRSFAIPWNLIFKSRTHNSMGGGSIFTYGTGNLLRPSVLLLGHSKQMPGHYLKLGYDRVPQYTTVYLNIRKCTSIYDRVPRYTTVYLNIRHSSSLLTTRLNF